MNEKCDDFIKDYLELKKSWNDMTAEERKHTFNYIMEIEGDIEKVRLLANWIGL